MNRIKPGGTMIMLYHKVEAWRTTHLMHTLSLFSKVRLYKPKTSHQPRNSFYLIATDVQPGNAEARRAVARWKRAWRRTSFWGSKLAEDDEGEDPAVVDGGDRVEGILEVFGERLIQLGRPIGERKRAQSGIPGGSRSSPAGEIESMFFWARI
jgi:hypothetical protein